MTTYSAAVTDTRTDAPTDEVLLARFAREESRHQAFDLIVKKYQRRIYWHVRKMVIDHDDADDLTQETFVKAWQHLAGFRGQAQLYTWLYRVATHACLSFLKKKRRRHFLPLTDVAAGLGAKLDQGAHLDGDAIALRLQRALLRLPDKQRLVFNMKYFDDLTYEEISQILGTSVGALKASYHLAVKKLEKWLVEMAG